MTTVDEWRRLGNEAAQLGGKLSGRVMWLYAELYAAERVGVPGSAAPEVGLRRAATEEEYARLKAVRADTEAWRKALRETAGQDEWVHEASWARWVEWLRARLAELGALASPGPSQHEVRRLQELLREAAGHVGSGHDDGWKDTSEAVRERHSQRCLSRAELFVAAGRDSRRFVGAPGLKAADRRLCRRAWYGYYGLALAWLGKPYEKVVADAWYGGLRARMSNGEVIVGAREWDWATDVADAVEGVNKLLDSWHGKGRELLNQERRLLSGMASTWAAVQRIDVGEAEVP